MTASPRKHTPDHSQDTLREPLVSDTYLLFDTPIHSKMPLPELPRLPDYQGETPAVTIRQMAPGQANTGDFHTCHEWRTQQGRLVCRCLRRDTDYLLSFPQQADFHIEAGGTINCMPAPGVAQGLLRHLLLNQVLPRYLAHTGEQLLHASAVTLGNGTTVAFLGESGFGKSTLASYCHLNGARFIDDDCILLRSGEAGLRITGGVPTLRLYPDSLRALGHNPAGFAPYAQDRTDKQQMSLAGQQAHGETPLILQALFLLGAPGEVPAEGAVTITPAGGQVALMSLVRGAFNLNPADKNTLRQMFQRRAKILADGLPVYHLNYPRAHRALPQVLQALMNWRHA
jgi:hypothetical protein